MLRRFKVPGYSGHFGNPCALYHRVAVFETGPFTPDNGVAVGQLKATGGGLALGRLDAYQPGPDGWARVSVWVLATADQELACILAGVIER